MHIRYACALLASALIFTTCVATAREQKVSRPGDYRGYSSAHYDGHELTSRYVQVRDGTRVAVDIFRPANAGRVAAGRFPIVWMHTPYNRRNTQGGLTAANYPGKALQLVKYGYVVAVADFRGTYASFGHNAGFNRGEWQDTARFDAYDITEWLASQPFSNGKIGMWGCSATGGSQMQALSTAPPHLKAIFPMSCEWDVYSWVAAGGITPAVPAPTQIMRGAPRDERDRSAVPVDADKDGTEMRTAIAEHKDNLETAGYVPFRDSVSKDFGNPWWIKSSPSTYRDDINKSGIAVYAATNWAEGFTGYGPPFTFNNLATPKKLIFGPGKHCDWSSVLRDTGFDIVVEELRFFDHWLRGIDNGIMREPAVTYYTYNEAPEKSWKSSPVWPLKNERRTAYYFSEGTLVPAAPTASAGETRMQVNYGVDDAGFWKSGMSFVTAPLDNEIEVTGHPVAHIWLSTTSTDADVIARIDDVAPDGTATYAGVEGKLRASMRALASAPYNNLGLPWHPATEDSRRPLEPNQPVELTFDLMPLSYLFKAGHRIRVTLQFADVRATAKVDPAPQVTILHRPGAASRIDLPVIPRSAATEDRAAAMAAMRERQNSIPDTPGTGRYPAIKEETPSLPEHVIYRPLDLGKLGTRKLGIYIFGNGACSNDGASSRLHLLEIASHGYLAIAPGRIRNGPGATVSPTPDPPPSRSPQQNPTQLPKPPTSAADLLSALDWALAESKDPKSPYFQKIDPNAVAISGYSCGGLQALQIAADPRVKTLIVMNSGIFNDNTQGISGIEVSKALLDQLHAPTFYILGGETDIAYPNGMDDFGRIRHVPAFLGNLIGVGHGGTYWEPNGGKAAQAVVAWLNWQLLGDQEAAKKFVGENCGLCRDPAWKFDRNHAEQ